MGNFIERHKIFSIIILSIILFSGVYLVCESVSPTRNSGFSNSAMIENSYFDQENINFKKACLKARDEIYEGIYNYNLSLSSLKTAEEYSNVNDYDSSKAYYNQGIAIIKNTKKSLQERKENLKFVQYYAKGTEFQQEISKLSEQVHSLLVALDNLQYVLEYSDSLNYEKVYGTENKVKIYQENYDAELENLEMNSEKVFKTLNEMVTCLNN